MEGLIYVGVELALFGMGTVFSFLVLLALAMVLMSKLASFLDNPSSQPQAIEQSSTIPNTELLAIITAAIAKHKRVKN